MQEPDLRMLSPRLLAGKRLRMTLADNRTPELWKSFMTQRKEIVNSIGSDLYSLQVYDTGFDVAKFNEHTAFEKWALVEVSDTNSIPGGMEAFHLPGGLYAVFIHKGPASEGPSTFRHIFGLWLPASDYTIDDRPHFEVLGSRYKNNEADSEEEIWIPVRKK